MKFKLSPWKVKAHDVILESCRRWRSSLHWDLSPARKHGDYVTLTLSDSQVSVSTEISLRLVWKGGVKKNFSYLQTLTGRLLDEYYAKHEAIADPETAAAQALGCERLARCRAKDSRMTFGEKRRAIRTLRRVARAMFEKQDAIFQEHGFAGLETADLSLTISREEFEQCEWAMQYLKQWIPDVDADTGELLPTGGYARINGLFEKASIQREHFLIKGWPVYYENAEQRTVA